MVDAQEALHARGLGALARAFAGFVLGLAHVHDGFQLFALRDGVVTFNKKANNKSYVSVTPFEQN